MRRIYTLLLYLLLPLVVLRFLWRSLRNPGYRQRLRERCGWLPPLSIQGGIWLHAVSVGEVQASVPLLRRLRLVHPGLPLVVTTTTPTGARRLERLLGSEVTHLYTPYDLPLIARRFLRQVQPQLAIFVETEIWPNLLAECRHQGIPTLLVNARMSERSAHGYARLGQFARETFGCLTQVAAQSPMDAARLQALGVPAERLVVTGSLKFDIPLPASAQEQAAALRRAWGNARPVWIAASTHAGEETAVLFAHRQLLAAQPAALLVLAPRHPERFERVAQSVLKHGFSLARRSEPSVDPAMVQVFLGDSMGELPMFFAAGDVAFVGGSLIPHGGHNLLEPAACGVPVITGPHYFNFTQIATLLIAAGGTVQVHNGVALSEILISWFDDVELRTRIGENAQRVVAENRGALDRLMTLLERYLPSSVTQCGV